MSPPVSSDGLGIVWAGAAALRRTLLRPPDFRFVFLERFVAPRFEEAVARFVLRFVVLDFFDDFFFDFLRAMRKISFNQPRVGSSARPVNGRIGRSFHL